MKKLPIKSWPTTRNPPDTLLMQQLDSNITNSKRAFGTMPKVKVITDFERCEKIVGGIFTVLVIFASFSVKIHHFWQNPPQIFTWSDLTAPLSKIRLLRQEVYVKCGMSINTLMGVARAALIVITGSIDPNVCNPCHSQGHPPSFRCNVNPGLRLVCASLLTSLGEFDSYCFVREWLSWCLMEEQHGLLQLDWLTYLMTNVYRISRQ